MKNIHKFLFGFLLFIAAFSKSQNNRQYPQGIKHVIVIGIDGMSPDGIKTAPTPVMHRLIKEGAVK